MFKDCTRGQWNLQKA